MHLFQQFAMVDGHPRIWALAEVTQYQQAICPTIDVITTPDDAPDLSYLEERNYDAPDYSPEERAQRQADDAARLRTFDKTWGMIGVLAVATVYLVHSPQAFQLMKIVTPGLWNVESDSDAAYLRSVGDEEIHTLRTILDQLHIYVPPDVTIRWTPVFAQEAS